MLHHFSTLLSFQIFIRREFPETTSKHNESVLSNPAGLRHIQQRYIKILRLKISEAAQGVLQAPHGNSK